MSDKLDPDIQDLLNQHKDSGNVLAFCSGLLIGFVLAVIVLGLSLSH